MIKLIKNDLSDGLTARELFLQNDQLFLLPGMVRLITCNRVEVYFGEGEVPRGVMQHLFRVTAGLESALLGETAIQGQVKNAYLAAQQNSVLSKEMHWLFQNALRVGKRIRRETGISRGAMSHSQAVIEILKIKKIDISRAQILVIGVANICEAVLKYLVKTGNQTTFLANRTYAKAQALSQKYNCSVARLDEMPAILADVDILISATAAPHFVVNASHFHCRKNMIIFDLAFPRDVDPKIGQNSKVTLLNVEEIEEIINANRGQRARAAGLAQAIINDELREIYGQN